MIMITEIVLNYVRYYVCVGLMGVKKATKSFRTLLSKQRYHSNTSRTQPVLVTADLT
jgi:hypothetical protein